MKIEKKNYLYRGVNPELHKKRKGLSPKKIGDFKYSFNYDRDRTIYFDRDAKFDSSEHNAVLRHQLNQEGFPTSGISTTPHFDRAKFYALANGRYEFGYVYKIDRNLLKKYKIKEYVVSEYINHPSVPEDDEVILVAENGGKLPKEIIVDIIPV
ncbi:hypothetical protein [Nitratifractor sp.]|uniref:hypothetical protein n=1 Tax=Nitratifractor sp. TaxID=2268144 RepID=UPI0025DCE7DC|nr:hypothetical protein [Nitratifractor sp.]